MKRLSMELLLDHIGEVIERRCEQPHRRPGEHHVRRLHRHQHHPEHRKQDDERIGGEERRPEQAARRSSRVRRARFGSHRRSPQNAFSRFFAI